MKRSFLLVYTIHILILACHTPSAAQDLSTDSPAPGRQPDEKITFQDSKGTKGSLFAVPGAFAIEREITQLESAERDALYSRDTAALKRLWAVDFSARNLRPDKVMPESSTSGLPFYAAFIRVVESVVLVGGLAYVHGVDHTSIIDLKKTSIDPEPHKFTHIWKMVGSEWKMISKFPSDY